MIDPLTTWQQVCEALAGPVGEAPQLPQEDFEAAFSILEAAIREADLQGTPASGRSPRTTAGSG